MIKPCCICGNDKPSEIHTEQILYQVAPGFPIRHEERTYCDDRFACRIRKQEQDEKIEAAHVG